MKTKKRNLTFEIKYLLGYKLEVGKHRCFIDGCLLKHRKSDVFCTSSTSGTVKIFVFTIFTFYITIIYYLLTDNY